MSDPTLKRMFYSVALVGALAGAVFGGVAGFLAGDSNARQQVASFFSVPPAAEDKLGMSSTQEAESAEAQKVIDQAASAAPLSDEDRRIAVVEKASPAVVSIIISKDVPVYEQYYSKPESSGNPFFDQFFGNMQVPQYRQNGTERKEVGSGSGFVVSADGYVVTNRHVVTDETAEYTVIFQNGEKFIGKVLARDTVNDIAVLKIEHDAGADGSEADFPYLEYGDSSSLKVGQSVVAIGYALGRFGNSVSNGIVAGLDRRIQAGDGRNLSEDLFDVIQTDAAINPGNSGGPLLDMHARVIGVNVAIVQGSQNIGFSLPINDVRRAVESVQKGGKIQRPFLGVRYQVIDKALQDKNQLTVDYGMLVARGTDPSELAVMPGSPADLAGIVENDILLELNGKKLTEDLPLAAALSKYGVDEEITLKILHKGEEKDVKVKLGERK